MKYHLMLAVFVTITEIYGCEAKKRVDQILQENQEWGDQESRYESFWGQKYQKPVFVINPFVLGYANEMKHKNRKTVNERMLYEVLPGVNTIEKGLIHAGQSVVHLLKGVGETALGIGGATYGGVIGALAGAGSGAVMGAQKGMLIAAGSTLNSTDGQIIHLTSDNVEDDDDDDDDIVDDDANPTPEDQ